MPSNGPVQGIPPTHQKSAQFIGARAIFNVGVGGWPNATGRLWLHRPQNCDLQLRFWSERWCACVAPPALPLRRRTVRIRQASQFLRREWYSCHRRQLSATENSPAAPCRAPCREQGLATRCGGIAPPAQPRAAAEPRLRAMHSKGVPPGIRTAARPDSYYEARSHAPKARPSSPPLCGHREWRRPHSPSTAWHCMRRMRMHGGSPYKSIPCTL